MKLSKGVVVAIAVAVVFVSVYYGLNLLKTATNPSNTPAPSFKPPPLLDIGLSPWENISATQGGSCQINITLSSKSDKNEFTIPLKLVLARYMGAKSIDQAEKTLSWIFNPNPVVLKPKETKSTVLTINVAEDAPSGEYIFLIEVNQGGLCGATFTLTVT
ncbi:MAG: hypothetical protein QXX08_03315 [Candidatus Bathyarchaeia archaeon]